MFIKNINKKNLFTPVIFQCAETKINENTVVDTSKSQGINYILCCMAYNSVAKIIINLNLLDKKIIEMYVSTHVVFNKTLHLYLEKQNNIMYARSNNVPYNAYLYVL